ncbi:kinase-like domain-containing protein [Aspergillus lucknowensis]|uniref:Kinase-like domain-containing protein n=1 Tax=Aspergillus lucknowensis TaxID=176173 RepID=A0ABR4M1R6_9EURO
MKLMGLAPYSTCVANVGYSSLRAARLTPCQHPLPSFRFAKYPRYYPAHIGEVLNSRYQVLTKLGFGSASTVWLCRDLRDNCYRVLKIHVRSRRPLPEVEVLNHLRAPPNHDHPGKKHVRLPLEVFELIGPHGVHPCLLYAPAGIDIRDFASYVQPNNLLVGINDESVLYEIEEDEISNKSPRKELPSRTIYTTHGMPITTGEPALSDLGEARIADSGNQTSLIMPSVYRALEMILGMEWNSKVDIWAVGQMGWTLFEKGHLFHSRDLDSEIHHAKRCAEMIALLGPPPLEFLRRSKNSSTSWDENGESKTRFLRFLRKTLQWRPEDRPTEEDLFTDEWVRGDDY